jgi:hypothetical protein
MKELNAMWNNLGKNRIINEGFAKMKQINDKDSYGLGTGFVFIQY